MACFYHEEKHRIYEGLKESSEHVTSISHRALGPEFHHFFKLQSFLPSHLESSEGLKTDHDADPEYEEAWTDTFYDLFLVAMMSKLTRMVLQGITSGHQFSEVPDSGSTLGYQLQDFQNFWHYGALVGFVLAFYGLWRALLYLQMHSRSNEKEDGLTTIFILFQLILVTILCIAVFHIEVCPEAEEAEEEPAEGGAERREEEEVEKLCVVYGVKYFGACLMLSHLMICMWHVLMTFHPFPKMALEEECLGEFTGGETKKRADETRVGKAMQKLTRRFSLLFAFKSLIWVLAGALHWMGAIKENDAKGCAILYCCAYIFTELTDVLGTVFGGFKTFEKRRVDKNGEWHWTTYEFIEEEAAAGINQYEIPIHVPFFNGRHKALMAIAFGESILQLTGASSSEPWLPNFRSMVSAVTGLLMIYVQASIYFHTFKCVIRDHPINSNKLSRFIWLQMQPVIVVGLCLLGASFEATWGANATYNAETYDVETAYGLGPAVRCFCYSNFLIGIASCMMMMVGQDRLRELSAYPFTSLVFHYLLPLVCNGMIIVPQYIDRWKHDSLENQFMSMAAIITFSGFYHVRIMHKAYFKCVNWEDDYGKHREESSDVCGFKLQFLRKNLMEQIEELQEQLGKCDKLIEMRGALGSEDSNSIKISNENSKFSNPIAKGNSVDNPKQDERLDVINY